MKSTLRKVILEQKSREEYKPDAHFEGNLQKILNNKIDSLKTKDKSQSVGDNKPQRRVFNFWFKPLFLAASIVLILLTTLNISKRFQEPGIVTLANPLEEIRKKADKFKPNEQIVHHKYLKTKYDVNGKVLSSINYEIWDDINDSKIRHITILPQDQGRIVQINDMNMLWIYKEKDKTLEKRRTVFETDGESENFKEPYTEIGRIIDLETQGASPNISISEETRDGEKMYLLKTRSYASSFNEFASGLELHYYFKKDTYELKEWQIFQIDGAEAILQETNKLELLEYTDKNDPQIKDIFKFDLEIPNGTKVFETNDTLQ